MKNESIPRLPAKNFVFPVLRPLLTMIKCQKGMARIDPEDPPPLVLKREYVSNAAFLAAALTELCGRSQIEKSESEPIVAALHDSALHQDHPLDLAAFGDLIKGLEDFSKKHKAALGESFRRDKEFFNDLYRKSVLKRKVRILHAPGDSPDLLVKVLTSGAWYEVDAEPIRAAPGPSEKHHVTILLCTNSREASEYVLQCERKGINIFLSDLGREIPLLDMNLSRTVNQVRRKGVKFISPPYVVMKLLPAVEDVYIGRLEEIDRSITALEGAMALEEKELLEAMDRAVLYAELIVEKAWKKTAGYAMEEALSESGKE